MPIVLSPPAMIWQEPQRPAQIPGPDFVVEVVAELPMEAKLRDVTQLLGRRQMAAGVNRRYLPTILELIMLVERNPARPPGRMWTSINALTIGYDAEARLVRVTYCLERCTPDPATGAMPADARMVSYTAPEKQVVARLDKKLKGLKKYAK